jgi:hypothetical protein
LKIRLKCLAYEGGPAVLDALLAAARGAAQAATARLMDLLLEVIGLPTDGPDALRVIMLYDRMIQLEAEAAGQSAAAVFRPVYDAHEESPPGSVAARAGVEATDILGPILRPPTPARGVTAGHGDGPSPTVVAAAKSA